MSSFKKTFLLLLTGTALFLSSCLHIVEEVTFRDKGNGNYKMTLDMSEMKGMMDMLKGMKPENGEPDTSGLGIGAMPDLGSGNPMGQFGEQMTGVADNLKGIPGISNVVQINDTTNFSFGYAFDFTDVAALNRALKTVNKEKYDAKVEEVFKFNGKSFERLATGDIGAELKKAMDENGGGEEAGGEQGMEMAKMFFADMSYEQVYRFPDRKIKKSSNTLSELSDENHTLRVKIKPFDEEQQKKKVSIATQVKLK